MSLEQLWAGWRMPYITGEGDGAEEGSQGCVFCRILSSGEPDDQTYVVWRGRWSAAVLNAYPYASGHLMVMPLRHLAGLEDLVPEEAIELWATLTDAVGALRSAYQPEGVNLGANLGRAAGAGLPDHLHLHALPRWLADTNFMTTVAATRVLPEALSDTWTRLRAAWPVGGDPSGQPGDDAASMYGEP
ncbi:MAG: HIT family hydrolase [Acidimicrobiales bacterium]|nr:MAG: HIT family hydrolase [Acidimicrobiales bacterium]